MDDDLKSDENLTWPTALNEEENVEEIPPRESAREGNTTREIRNYTGATGSRAMRTNKSADHSIPKSKIPNKI